MQISGKRGERLHVDVWPAAVYAVGDVHGCQRQLITLEQAIISDAERFPGEKLLVMLGDYIDRGPASAQVIEHLLAPPPIGFRRVCLRGNHEQMMLDFLRDPVHHSYWLDEGGDATIASYGIEVVPQSVAPHLIADYRDYVMARLPETHLRFIDRLTMYLALPGWLFVHAGIRPDVALEQQRDEDLIWIREEFLYGPAMAGTRVVHGHTPTPRPVVTPARVGVDTQCFRTGRLTAVRATPDGEIAFLSTS